MSKLKNWSLLSQTWIFITLASVLTLVTFVVISTKDDAQKAMSDLEAQLKLDLEIINSSFNGILVVEDYATLEQQLRHFVQRENVKSVQFVDEQNIKIIANQNHIFNEPYKWFYVFFSQRYLDGQVEAIIGGKKYGTFNLTLTADDYILSSWVDFKSDLKLSILILSINFLLLGFILKIGLNPLTTLNKVSQKIGEGYLDVRAPIEGPIELQNFANAFNLMADKIQHLLNSLEQREIQIEAQRVSLFHSSKLAALGEMASGIAHEINNPLQIITSKVNKIEKNVRSDVFDRQVVLNDLEKIISTSFRINKIVGGLRVFARRGESDPFESSNLHDIIVDTLGYCQERFRNNGVDLRMEEFSNLVINCRPTQISQVILNLLNNSFDSVLGKENPWIQLHVTDLQEIVQISVTDSGRGIPVEIAEKIMLPFFTTKDSGKGTGLGLSISHQIISEHQGQIYYNSKSQNTQFIIELPKDQKKEIIKTNAIKI